MKLLVVDDDQDYQDYMDVLLRDLGFSKITQAASSDEALTLIERSSFDFVFADLIMPGVDGVQFLRLLSESAFEGKILIISGTGSKLIESICRLAQIYNLNIVGSLDKGNVSREQLNHFLKNAASLKDRHSQLDATHFKEWELREAIARDELCLHYQPKLCAKTAQITGLEALVRWNHPTLGQLAPNVFIEQIERFHLNESLSQWVIINALNDLSEFYNLLPNTHLSINLSVLALYNLKLTKLALSHCEKHKIDPSNITLEITESQLLERASAPLETITRLSLHGFKLSIDDFGTGYSSLEQLNKLPFNELKIDQSFVFDAPHSNHANIIVESCIKMAKQLNLQTVAEGVETKEAYDLMRTLGCDQLQGFYIAKPMSRKHLKRWIKEYKPDNNSPSGSL